MTRTVQTHSDFKTNLLIGSVSIVLCGLAVLGYYWCPLIPLKVFFGICIMDNLILFWLTIRDYIFGKK